MELLDKALNHLVDVLPIIAAAGGVSVVLQLAKKWLSLQSEKVVNFLLAVFSFIPVAVQYVIQAAQQNPAILGQRTAVIMGLSTVLYHQLVKPTTNLLKDAKAERERRERVTAVSTPEQPLVTDEDVSDIIEDPTVTSVPDELVA